MKLTDLHDSTKAVSALAMFNAEEGKVIALQILKNETLKEHITKVPALLTCISGEAVFENEDGFKEIITQGSYILIEPMVKHWVAATVDSNFVLIK